MTVAGANTPTAEPGYAIADVLEGLAVECPGWTLFDIRHGDICRVTLMLELPEGRHLALTVEDRQSVALAFRNAKAIIRGELPR